MAASARSGLFPLDYQQAIFLLYFQWLMILCLADTMKNTMFKKSHMNGYLLAKNSSYPALRDTVMRQQQYSLLEQK
ncbi:MAG: hypothetical protein H6985_14055 [Pseudomonadales bacterium]|nr:hypothetical protein [Pseudomonadales bacterium]